ncbi:hypothetical protein [uncultured Brachyspira sp.]|uniref:hypothetical protein n=1 Tax=uncultured Brachyspira sp. TaxID=221953 RepID=UPI0026331950|nr:hypothetical protein [uncultured Brachyspira sp.]
MKHTLLLILIFIILSCTNNKNTSAAKRDEIEPNDSLEYSQFIDYNVSINASFDSIEDIDYYQIKPTNATAMDFYISIYDNKANVDIEVFSTNNRIFSINTKDILNYNGFIELTDLLLYDDSYFVKLHSDKECKYSLKFLFKDNYLPSNEIEPNNTINDADTINYPNELIYGYFFKNDLDGIDEFIKPYIRNSNLIDIDLYKLENTTDINSSINIKLEYAKDVTIMLFDEQLNLLKNGQNQLNTHFNAHTKYYIALVYYGEKAITNRYTLYYEFN